MHSTSHNIGIVRVFFISSCLFFVFFLGCTQQLVKNAYIGKWFHKVYLREIEDTGKHYFRHENLDIKYDYAVSRNDGIMTLKGTLEYNKSIEDSKFKHETVLLKYQTLVLICLFTDQNGTVIAVEMANLPTGGSIVEPVNFEVTIPYKSDYKYILTNYSAYAQGG